MQYEIDQSGKVEQTNRITVVAISNGKQYAISLASAEKKILQEVFRKSGTPKMFMIQTFACLVFLCVKNIKDTNSIIVVDSEYSGFGDLIKNYVFQLINSENIKIKRENFRYGFVGKKSHSHLLANKVFNNKRSDKKISYKEIMSLILRLKK